ncbi:MAG: hypothetical protein ABIH10_00930 [Spirochaetota bacterium]
MNEEKEKLNKIKWWHLVVIASAVSIFLIGNRNSLTTIIIGMFFDILGTIGLCWGILLLIKYIYNKIVKKKND